MSGVVAAAPGSGLHRPGAGTSAAYGLLPGGQRGWRGLEGADMLPHPWVPTLGVVTNIKVYNFIATEGPCGSAQRTSGPGDPAGGRHKKPVNTGCDFPTVEICDGWLQGTRGISLLLSHVWDRPLLAVPTCALGRPWLSL